MPFQFNPLSGMLDLVSDLSGYLKKLPTATADNTIVPFSGSIVPLTIQGKSAGVVEGVTWINASGNVSVVGSQITKSAADAWNAGARSSQTITTGNDGYVEWTCGNAAYLLMCGLSEVDPDYNYLSIGFAIYMTGGQMRCVEKGTVVATPTTLTTGDLVRVAIESNVVKYYKNGVVQYTSLVAPTYPSFVDVAIYSNSGTITPTISSGSSGAHGTDLLAFKKPDASSLGAVNKDGWNGILTGTPYSALHVNGSFQLKRTATAVSMTAATTDYMIAVTSTAAPRTITLPTLTANEAGRMMCVKDESGGALTNPITVSCAAGIDGDTTLLINLNYGSFFFYWNGTKWSAL